MRTNTTSRQQPATVDLLETGLPSAIDAEKLILGSILKGSVDFWECRSALAPEDFMLEKHRLIWRRMLSMHEAGHTIDRVTLAQSLIDSHELEAVDGLTYIVSLDDLMPHIKHVDHLIKLVRDKSVLRRVIAVSEKIKSEAVLGGGDTDPTELLTRAEKMLIELGLEASSSETFLTPGDVIRRHGSLQKYFERGRESGSVPFGYRQLDAMTCGMCKKQLIILAARPGVGKTTKARNIALAAARQGYPGAFVTLEMSDEETTDGFICAAGEIDTQVVRRGLMRERERVGNAAREVAELPIYIRDKAGCTVDQLHGELRKLKAERGIMYAIVDYLQLMSPGGRYENRNVEVSVITRGLKLIAMDLDIPVLALSQLKRMKEGGDPNPRPQLTDLRDSGSIEQDANVVIFLWSNQLITEAIVAKQRNGPLGTLYFWFEKTTGVFHERPHYIPPDGKQSGAGGDR